MNEKDWFILSSIHKEKNITKAAENIHISQPALTYRLQQIENELAIKIFSRSKKGIKFTAEGEHLVNYANEMIIHLRKLKDRLLDMSDNVHGELRIGVSSNYAHYKLPAILKKFMSIYPNIQIKVKTGWSTNILKALLDEEVHVGIIRGDYDWDGPKVLINEDPMCLISKQTINLEELPKLPRISYKTDPNLKELIEKWWQSRFTQPPLETMEVDKLETCKEMVINGLGYGIIPRYLLQNEEQGLFIKNLRTSDGQPIFRKLWMFHRANELDLTVVKAFVEFIKQKHEIS